MQERLNKRYEKARKLRRTCSRCGHETAGTRRVRPDLCGPCLMRKPIGFWDQK